MDNGYPPQTGFEFLSTKDMQDHFAELNIELLRGKHITPYSSALYSVLDTFEKELVFFYKSLYDLLLEKRTHDSLSYYYLEFPVSGRGKLSNPSLYAEMDGKTTIVACILANLYFTNYFSYDKKFHWDDIQYEIEHGEHRTAYQQLFFGKSSQDYTDKQWDNIKKQFGIVINFFNRIGLVEKEDSEEAIHFTILPTIHHFIEVYKNEIENIDGFLNELKL
jgi:hypothetical protein